MVWLSLYISLPFPFLPPFCYRLPPSFQLTPQLLPSFQLTPLRLPSSHPPPSSRPPPSFLPPPPWEGRAWGCEGSAQASHQWPPPSGRPRHGPEKIKAEAHLIALLVQGQKLLLALFLQSNYICEQIFAQGNRHLLAKDYWENQNILSKGNIYLFLYNIFSNITNMNALASKFP